MAGKRKKQEPDFLDEMIELSTAEDPNFPALLAAAEARRQMMRALAKERKRQGLSQQEVARRMGTSQPAIARLETQDDAHESTLDLYASALGMVVVRKLRSRPAIQRPRDPAAPPARPMTPARQAEPHRLAAKKIH